jgi:hypothetical protein
MKPLVPETCAETYAESSPKAAEDQVRRGQLNGTPRRSALTLTGTLTWA